MVAKNKKLIAVVGPTASGKTSLGVFLAKKFSAKGGPASGWNGAEIVSADSRQIYRGLDIGTGKDLSEYDGIKYHLIDICKPGEKFTLFDYLNRARKIIDDIFSRGKLPIIVGGTGLYIQALTQGFILSQKSKIKNDESHPELDSGSTSSRFRVKPGMTDYQREELEKMPLLKLQALAKKVDLASYQKVDQINPIRLIRLIERAQSGERMSKQKPDFEVLQIGMNLPREELYQKIDRRVDERFDKGMLEEVQGLINHGVDSKWLISLGLEYRIITSFLTQNSKLKSQKCNLKLKNYKTFEDMKQDLKYKIHQFARRQLTWFRRFPEIKWVKDKKEAELLVKKYL